MKTETDWCAVGSFNELLHRANSEVQVLSNTERLNKCLAVEQAAKFHGCLDSRRRPNWGGPHGPLSWVEPVDKVLEEKHLHRVDAMKAHSVLAAAAATLGTRQSPYAITGVRIGQPLPICLYVASSNTSLSITPQIAPLHCIPKEHADSRVHTPSSKGAG